MAHNWLEQYFKSGEPGPAPEHPKAGHCVDAALKWLHEHQVEKLEVERRIYSRKHQFSGTLDKLAIVDGKKCLIDWKSSKGVYTEYKLQTAAYVGAYEEETGEYIEGRWLIKLGKEDGEFEAHWYPRATQRSDYKAFKNALGLLKYLKANETTF